MYSTLKKLNCMTDESLNKSNFMSNNNTVYCVAKEDSGATSHYWTEKNEGILKNVKKIKGPSVQLTDSTMIPSTEQGDGYICPHISLQKQQNIDSTKSKKCKPHLFGTTL